MQKPTMPDFVKWANNLVDREDVSIALEQAFNQGHSLGYLEGKENGWIKDWDAVVGGGLDED